MSVRNDSTRSGSLVFSSELTRPSGSPFALGLWVRTAGHNQNTAYALIGTNDSSGSYTGPNDCVLRFGGDTANQGTARRRPVGRFRSDTGNTLFGVDSRTFETFERMEHGRPFFIIYGMNRVGTLEEPVLRSWMAFAHENGPVSSSTHAPTGNWATTGGRTGIRRLYNPLSTNSLACTPTNTFFEHLGFVHGNFPWDAGNDRPDHALIEALAAGTATWADVNALPGLALAEWRPLKRIGELEDVSGASTRTLVLNPGTSGALLSGPLIAPGAWNESENAAATIAEDWDDRQIMAGRGVHPIAFTGTTGGSTLLRVRAVNADTGASETAWHTPTIVGEAWRAEIVVPAKKSPMRLELDDMADDRQIVSTLRFYSGLVVGFLAQSQFTKLVDTVSTWTAPSEPEMVAEVLDFAGGGRTAGGASYVRPTLNRRRITNPANIGSGVFSFCVRLSRDLGMPVGVLHTASPGTNISQWATNAFYNSEDNGTGGWRYMGNGVNLPGLAGHEDSGIMTFMAIHARRGVDAWTLNWGPGFSQSYETGLEQVQQVMSQIDGMFLATPPAPVIVSPYHRTTSSTEGPTQDRKTAQRRIGRLGGRFWLAPEADDVHMEGTSSAHPAASPSQTVPEVNGQGSARLGAHMARAVAAYFNPLVKAWGPKLLRAWFEEGRTQIVIETGRRLRTMNGAAVRPEFWVSTNGGSSWSRTGYTVELSETRVILSFAAPLPLTNVRVDYLRERPFLSMHGFGPETQATAGLAGLVYDEQNHRMAEAGQHLARTGENGIVVNSGPAGLGPRLVMTGKPSLGGPRTVRVRMRHAHGERTRTLPIQVDLGN